MMSKVGQKRKFRHRSHKLDDRKYPDVFESMPFPCDSTKVLAVESHIGCWIWAGYVGKDGYARFCVDGKMRVAHRLALESHLGRPLKEKTVAGRLSRYVCPHKHCVNPFHLREKTRTENNCDLEADNLSYERLMYIRKDPTRSVEEIAIEMNLDPDLVRRVKTHEVWDWLTMHHLHAEASKKKVPVLP